MSSASLGSPLYLSGCHWIAFFLNKEPGIIACHLIIFNVFVFPNVHRAPKALHMVSIKQPLRHFKWTDPNACQGLYIM